MVWSCIFSKGVSIIRISDEIITKEVYLTILKNELTASIKKFSFIVKLNTNPIKIMILTISLIYVSAVYYTTAPNLLIILPKVLILIMSKICGLI